MDQQNKTKPEDNPNKSVELADKELDQVAGGVLNITTGIQSPRDAASGLPTGIVSPRDAASGLPTGFFGNTDPSHSY